MKKKLFLILFIIGALTFLLFIPNLKSPSKLDSTENKLINLLDSFKSVKNSPIDQLSTPVSSGGGAGVTSTALGENQVYIKNNNAFAIANHLVSIPISFAPCEYTDGQNDVRFRDISGVVIPTQIQATGFYQKDSTCSKGSVMFAVAHVQVSLAPGEERVYDIVRSFSNPGSFVYAPEVQDFLTNGQLKSISRDINGRGYTANVPLNNLQWVVNGPIIKIAKYEKMNELGVACSGGPSCLDFLFSTVTYLTFVNNEPIVRAEVFVVNSPNFNELTPASTACLPANRNARGNCVYKKLSGYNQGIEIWSIGNVKYESLSFEVNGGPNHNFYFPDLDIRQPTTIDEISPNSVTVWMMPADGQYQMGCIIDPTGTGGYCPSTNPTLVKNYLGQGQGLLVRGTINFRNYLTDINYQTHDYFVENNIGKGQSLKRWAKADTITTKSIPDTTKLGDSARWYSASDALDARNNLRYGEHRYPQDSHHFANNPVYQSRISEPSAGD